MSAPTATSLRQHYVQVLKLPLACTNEEIAARLATSTPEELLELDRRLQDSDVDAFLAQSDPHPGVVDLDDEPMKFDETRAGRGAPYLRQMLRRAGVPEDRWVQHADDGAAAPGSARGASEHEAGEPSASWIHVLNALVASLPEFERNVVNLMAFEELSDSEASNALGVPRMQVIVAFKSAIAKLQQGLIEARSITVTRVPEVLRQALKLS